MKHTPMQELHVVCPRVHTTTKCKNIRWAWQRKQLQNNSNYNSNNKTNSNVNMRRRSYISTDHLAQFLATNILLEAEMDNPAASSSILLP